jgi:Na+/proline symporter
MTSALIITVLLIYFAVLFLISRITARNATNQSFFQANKSAPWMLVAFGMVGTSLSGVTFISVPGTVGGSHFNYFQVVIGYFIGYFAVAYILLPLYYRYNLTSIYTYLQHRFGFFSYKTGASLFIISRTLGATLRLYLVINVLQLFVLDEWNFPFWATAAIILLMILLYTFKGGVKTIVWTDTLQTFFMLLALVVCVVYITNDLGLSFSGALQKMSESNYLEIFNTNISDKKYFLKQIIGGAFITISMTGLDQEMMQKNISVRTLKDSQKNMLTFNFIMVVVNFIFLFLGGMLYLYATSKGLDLKGDDLFPTIAMQHLPTVVSLIFIIGLISALFPSADGAITALTASFCIDILGMKKTEGDKNSVTNHASNELKNSKTRKTVHLGFCGLFLIMVLFFKIMNNKEVVTILLDIAGYTYGPLLGLFAFGVMTKRMVKDRFAPIVCLLAPTISFIIDKTSQYWLGDYKFGFEMLAINGIFTFIGLWLISTQKKFQDSHDSSISEWSAQ